MSGLSGELQERGRRLRDELVELMGRGTDAPLPDPEFNDLAVRVFRFQAAAIPVYGAFAHQRGLDPDGLDDWRRIPPVPTRAFRSFHLMAGDPEMAEAVFRTSGTSGGPEARGTHRVRDLGLYRASLLPNARTHLNPEGERVRVLALFPDPARRPESSLAHMAGVLLREWDDGGGGFYADEEWNLRAARLHEAVARAREHGIPVLVLATAFGLVHLLEGPGGPAGEPPDLTLPPGSRIMETGGFKGRSREVDRQTLYRRTGALFGLPPRRIVNEYGMTELLSQFYESALGRGEAGDVGDDPERELRGPPWVRTRVLDPSTLDPLEPGRPGLLCHLDLANLYSISAVLTEDMGLGTRRGFRVLGRAPGAEPRGCSLTMEALLQAREEKG